MFTVKIKETSTHPQVDDFGGSEIIIEGLWKEIFGQSWMYCEGNPTCLIYSMRVLQNNLPFDNNVYYCKINGIGHLVHESEIIREKNYGS